MKSRMLTAIFALLFAVGFGAGGVFGISSLSAQIGGWWQARSWQKVPATVIDTSLKESGGDPTTYKVTVHYRYKVNGMSFDGTRVGFVHGSDNVGTWQQDQYDRISNAKRLDQPIMVWVNPLNPSESVINRNIRWNMLAFSLPFAFLFSSVSLGALWVFVRTWRPATPPAVSNAAAIESDARSGVSYMWGFAIVWGLIAFPIAFLFVPQEFGRSWWWLAVMLFPLVGVGLIWVAAARTLRLLRNGEVTIALSPIQPKVGDTIIVRASFSRTPSFGDYRMSLVCEEVDTRGEDTRCATIWQQERAAQMNGASLAASFSPPGNLPASQPATGVYCRWRVALNFPDGKDERDFNILVGANADATSEASVAAAADEFVIDGTVGKPIPESVATVVDGLSKLKIDYNPANARHSGIAAAVFGCVFGGIGLLMLLSSSITGAMPTMMGLIVAAVGIGLLAASIYSFTHRRSIDIAQGHVRISNRWVLNSKQQDFAVSTVDKLVMRIKSISRSGSKRRDHHEIKAVLKDRREIIMASGIFDAGVAVTLLKMLQRHLALDDAAVVAIAATGLNVSKLARNADVSGDDEIRLRRGIWVAKIVAALLTLVFIWDSISPFVLKRH